MLDPIQDILAPAARGILDDVARRRTLLAFDFDGTLAPIVRDRAAAQLRPETRALLRAVALLYPCAIVSGRARSDVAARVAGIPLVAIVGNHGSEAGFGPLNRAVERRVDRWAGALSATLGDVAGAELENKRFSIAVHYRNAPASSVAEERVLSAVRELDGARVFGGSAVVNVVPVEAPTKGDAIREVCRRTASAAAVFVGDDVTDEDAFRSDLVEVSIRVGRHAGSAARYAVADQRAVDDLLQAFVAARARQDGRGDRWQALVRAVAR